MTVDFAGAMAEPALILSAVLSAALLGVITALSLAGVRRGLRSGEWETLRHAGLVAIVAVVSGTVALANIVSLMSGGGNLAGLAPSDLYFLAAIVTVPPFAFGVLATALKMTGSPRREDALRRDHSDHGETET